MTPRSLWIIIIKILGINILISALILVPQAMGSAFMVANSFSRYDSPNMLIAIGVIIFALTIVLIGLWLFLFKTNWLIDILALDKHFREEKLEINIQMSTVVQIAIIVVGGILFIDSLPELCRQIFIFYQQKSIFSESPTIGWLIFYFAKTVIAYILITNSKRITNWIERNKQENSNTDTHLTN